MKRLLAILCTLALLLSIAPAAVFAAENSDLQAAKDDDSSEIIVLEEDTSNLTVNHDTTIDLNGYDLDGVSVQSGTLYLLDSQTADYTVADGVYGEVTNVTGAVEAAEGYLQVGNSFHAVNLDIYAMTLRAADVGVYYKSQFAADEIVAAEVESFGVALSVVTAPNAENLETYCGYSEFTGFEAGEGANAVGTSTLLKGIMKEANGDNKNAKNAAMPVYGRAYIKTAEGYVFGETVGRSLQEQVEAIDGVWEKLTDAQKAPVLGMLESYASVMEGWNIPNIKGGEAGEGAGEITVPVEVTTENGVVTETVTVEQGAVSITVPAGVKLAEGVSALTLTVTPKETSDAGLTLEQSEVLMPMDVHVEGLAADNAQPITIYLGKVMAENLNMGNYTVYHVENGKANEMTLIPVDAEFSAHNQYKYTLDGELTLYMATFSEVAVVSNVNNVWEGKRDYSWYDADAETLFIRNADQLAGFGAIVGGMAEGVEQDDFTGKTVVLLADIAIGDTVADNGKVFYPIGYYNNQKSYTKMAGGSVTSNVSSFSGIFDGNGNTISDFYQNTWEMFGDYNDGYEGTPNHYDDAMGLFGYVLNGTVKNLTVSNFSSDGEYAPTGVIAAYAINSTFENIAIINCNPRVYNTGNGGIVGIGGNYGDTENDKLTFKNITVDNSNKISALWGSWDVACGGLMGMFRGNADGGNGKAHFENCHVSAQIDVYNDVCANYQYYAYRYSGMMIGSVRHNETVDGRVYPNMAGITAENCTVHFGDWNDYYYCELVANTVASYTHDHQMSRLVQVDSVDVENMKIVTLKGEEQAIPTSGRVNYVVVKAKGDNGMWIHGDGHDYAECYHFVDGEVWNHEDAGTETVNGEQVLKEDKQLIYREFNNLITGYGWGVTTKGVKDLDGVTILDREIPDSHVKFDVNTGIQSLYANGMTVSIGQLFNAAELDGTGLSIKKDQVQVTVSPADETSTAGGIYTAYSKIEGATTWAEGTLTFTGVGKAKITITDYYFCIPTTITVEIKESYAGSYYIAAIRNEGNYFYMTNDLGTATTKRYQAENSGLTQLPEKIEDGAENKIFTFVLNNDGTYKIYANGIDGEAKFLGHNETNEGSNGILVDEANALNVTILIDSNGLLRIQGNDERYLSLNSTAGNNYFAWYKNGQKHPVLIPVAACEHKNTEEKAEIPSTCTVAGYAAGTYCLDCGTYISGGAKLELADHTDENSDNICDICEATIGSTDPGEGEETVEKWVLVTDASTLKAGDQLMIGIDEVVTSKGERKGDFVAGEISSNIMASVEADIDENYTISTKPAEAVVLTLGGSAGAWTFTNESGKLLGATAEKKVAWSSGTTTWSISINGDGDATIQSTASNYGRFLYNVYSPRFTTYKSSASASMILPQLYRLETTGGSTEPDTPECEHTNITTTTVDATCIAEGSITVTCDDCGETISTEIIEATGEHIYEDGTCSVCGAEEPDVGNTEPTVVATFALGTDGTATHNEGAKNPNYSETDGDYLLSLTSNDGNMYTGARDAKGNGCIKLGKSGTAGSFTFTVPADVTAVKIYIAKYKTNTSKVTINGTTYTLSNNSDSGEYDVITIDTTTDKTVSVTTVSGGVRAMVNTIEFYASGKEQS